MKNKRITAVLTAFCLCTAGTGIPEGCFEIYENLTVHAEAEVKITNSGKCGDNLTWKLDSNGTFTIEGTGAMENWTEPANIPWHTCLVRIKSVKLPDGLTDISEQA
ncbi:MAG: hypothetical protein MJ095_08430, partial [Oscillospiraceae bacterium]|nr:hypothetical protein [Oscillospiraceae bacterium]